MNESSFIIFNRDGVESFLDPKHYAPIRERIQPEQVAFFADGFLR